jgi:hypothetical protein
MYITHGRTETLRILVEKPECKMTLGRFRCICEVDIKIGL